MPICIESYSYNSDILLIAVCYDTSDLFQIIIHSYSELSSRENYDEEDVFQRIKWTKLKQNSNNYKRDEVEL